MPKVSKELGALEVKRLRHPGTKGNVTFSVGGVAGLLLQITPKGSRTWLLRTMVGSKRREIGLGGFPEISLGVARERAREAKDKILRGIDPVEERKTTRAALIASQSRNLTFGDAMSRCLAARLDEFRNSKHRDQWRNTLQTYALPFLGDMFVQDILVQDILRVMNQPTGPQDQNFWRTKTETAARLRGRIETVLTWSTVQGYRSGENPARWAGNLKELLPAPSRIGKKDNHPAVQIDDAPRWFSAVKTRSGMGSRALEFAALTAARSREVRGATWAEINFDAKLWVVPAVRMKMDKEHRVPLTDYAVNLLRSLPKNDSSRLIFPAQRGGEMSDMTLSATMKRIHESARSAGGQGFIDRVNKRVAVPHGLRSTFRDWVAERTTFPSEMAEIALAHKVGNAVEAAYRRGDMIEKRRAMMTDWNDYLNLQ